MKALTVNSNAMMHRDLAVKPPKKSTNESKRSREREIERLRERSTLISQTRTGETA